MIDMRGLHQHPAYPLTLQQFTQSFSSDCTYSSWGMFKNLHLSLTKYKCPICECSLDQYNLLTRPSNKGIMSISATIDHFRPKAQNLYPLLKCDDKNYLLMCKDCNEAYKGNLFPLYRNQIRDITSTSSDNITTERPLIVNPIYDNLLELFILVFTYSRGKKILELQPKYQSGYLHEKAKKTIKIFNLGNCEVNTDPTSNIDSCRINLLHKHYSQFYEFIEALTLGNYKEALQLKDTHKLEDYGFYIFIQKMQFKYLV